MNLTFGEALIFLKHGKTLARGDWNRKRKKSIKINALNRIKRWKITPDMTITTFNDSVYNYDNIIKMIKDGWQLTPLIFKDQWIKNGRTFKG